MKKSKKHFFIIVICVLSTVILAMGTILGIGIFTDSDIIYTTDIEDYFALKAYRRSQIFPEEIPDNAQVVSFYYYDYWHEDTDVFLELQFQSEAELETYIELRVGEVQKEYQNQHGDTAGRCFVEKTNPYSQSYNELYYSGSFRSSSNKDYLGYSFDPDENAYLNYNCHFGVISYSNEDLRVVFSYTSGTFRNRVQQYTPAYFIRFKVPTTEAFENYIFLE